VTVGVRLNVERPLVAERTQFRPRRKPRAGCAGRVSWAALMGVISPTRDRVQDGLESVLLQQYSRHRPHARPRIVEAQRDGSFRKRRAADERRDVVGTHGAIAVRREVLQLLLEVVALLVVEVEDWKHASDTATEDESRIAACDQVEAAAQPAAALAERYAHAGVGPSIAGRITIIVG